MTYTMHEKASGQPWWVYSPLQNDEDLVIPEPVFVGPSGPGGANVTRHGLVITGIYYHVISSAAGVGFTLRAVDDSFNPGTTSTFTIWRAESIVAAANVISLALSNLWIPLTRAQNYTTPSNGAKINLDVTATPPSAGSSLIITGLHTTDAWGVYSGSPITF